MYPLAFVLTVLSASPTQNKPPSHYIKTEDAKTIVATLTYEVTCEKLQATEWIVFGGLAPELPSQTKVKTTMSPAGSIIAELSPFGRKILMAQVKANSAALKTKMPISVTYSATLRSRNLMPVGNAAAPSVSALTEKERTLYLTEFGDCDYSDVAFKKWMKSLSLNRRENEREVDFARRVFLAIRSNFKYEYKSTMDRSASVICATGKSDCGGLSMLFVAVMRAAGVPARTLYGRWAESAKPDEKADSKPYYQWHVKAEFFATEIGWVPLDMASGILHDKTSAGLEYFGKDRGDFLTIHIDPNVIVDTKLDGQKTLMGLQQPAFWVRGSGTYEPVKIVEDWKVK